MESKSWSSGSLGRALPDSLCLTDSLSSLEVVGTCYLDVELPDKSGLNVTFQSVHVSNFLQAICLTWKQREENWWLDKVGILLNLFWNEDIWVDNHILMGREFSLKKVTVVSVCFFNCCRYEDEKVEFLTGGLSQTEWVADLFFFFLSRAIFWGGKWIVSSFLGLSFFILVKWVANEPWSKHLPALSDTYTVYPDSKLYKYVLLILACFCKVLCWISVRLLRGPILTITKLLLLVRYSSYTWTKELQENGFLSSVLQALNRWAWWLPSLSVLIEILSYGLSLGAFL